VRQLVVFQSRPVSRLRYTQLGVWARPLTRTTSRGEPSRADPDATLHQSRRRYYNADTSNTRAQVSVVFQMGVVQGDVGFNVSAASGEPILTYNTSSSDSTAQRTMTWQRCLVDGSYSVTIRSTDVAAG
jgi:hypothetical protein